MAAADRLARFITDLEPRKCELADLFLVNRFDCEPPRDLKTYASRRFQVCSYQTKVTNTGWPNGCNGLWAATMCWIYNMMAAERIPSYKAIFTCEADGGPICSDWIAQMSQEWDRVNAVKPVYMAGPLVKSAVINEHINGNALMSGNMEFLKWVTRSVTPPPAGAGWDYCMAPQFRAWGWANIDRMRSYYNSATFTREQYAQMRAEHLIWVHGIKDDSLIRFGREQLIPEQHGQKR